MSGAILYLAIVAIWAVVLVPRWLHPRQAPPQPVPVPVEDAGAERPGGADPNQGAAPAWTASAGGPDTESEQAPGEDTGDESREAAPSPVIRPEMVKARRRLLVALLGLTAIAAALAVTRVEAYWIIIPPAALLSGYLLLLRQFAQFDAERARRMSRVRHAAQARATQEPSASGGPVSGDASVPQAPATRDGAEIIDISGRIVDQVYDQYSDAAYRAVGD